MNHTQVGVWNVSQQNSPKNQTKASWKSSLVLLRLLHDILQIPHCTFLLSAYILIQLVLSLIPAVSLYFSSRLLDLLSTNQSSPALVPVILARFSCSALSLLLSHINKTRILDPLNHLIRQHYNQRQFHLLARLDVPTYTDPYVQNQIQQAFSSASGGSSTSLAMSTLESTLKLATTLIHLLSQLGVLSSLLGGTKDANLLFTLSFAYSLSVWVYNTKSDFLTGGAIWSASTKDALFLRMQGLKQAVSMEKHRKEIVAGDMWSYMYREYTRCSNHLGRSAGEFFALLAEYRANKRLGVLEFLREPMGELPLIIYTLRIVFYPQTRTASSSSLLTLTLISTTTASFSSTLLSFLTSFEENKQKWEQVERFYEVLSVGNRVKDGSASAKEQVSPFPKENTTGLAIRFDDVSFRYPSSPIETWALRNVSFTIPPGGLCVLLGTNGSGKSTILKLCMRLYDVDEGEIHIRIPLTQEWIPIKRFGLTELRRMMAVLFQDYTLFPLSIKENIALGDPELAEKLSKITSSSPEEKETLERIHRASTLGGSHSFLTNTSKFPEGYDTIVERPSGTGDVWSGVPGYEEESSSGEGLEYVQGAIEEEDERYSGQVHDEWGGFGLSGGQVQRIALSRTFLRSLSSPSDGSTRPRVSLLLFDEPSASLDPQAEHDLFERLRELRGEKTMIFSSHRFGRLTRGADLILYIHDSRIVESGSHAELIEKGGEYARVWELSKRAFED